MIKSQNVITIYNAQRNVKITKQIRSLIIKAAEETLKEENVFYPCEISIKIVTDAAIKKLNRDFRKVDSATDVLSFPADEPFPADGEVRYLGDMAIAAQFASAQAMAAGGTLEREITLLTAHSVLHLLGYDHAEPDEEKIMFAKQNKIVEKVFSGDES